MDLEERRQQFLTNLGATIAEHGWAIQGVGGYRPWSYTIGLSDRGHPGAILPIVPFDTAGNVLNTIGQACFDGVDVTDPQALAEVFGHERVFFDLRPVDPSWNDTDLFNIAHAYYRSYPDVVQVVLADDQGRFPWDAGHDLGYEQPVLWEPYAGGWPVEIEEN